MDNFERFRDQHTVVLTTFRRDGTRRSDAGEPRSRGRPDHGLHPHMEHLRQGQTDAQQHPLSVSAPSTFRGKVTGPPTPA